MSAVEPLERAVDRITYLANSSVPGRVIICFLLALYYRGTKFISDGKERFVVVGAFCSDNLEQSWSVFYPITSKKSA